MKALLLVTIMVLAYPDVTAPTVSATTQTIEVSDLAACRILQMQLAEPYGKAEQLEAAALKDHIRELEIASVSGRLRVASKCMSK